MVSKFGLVKLAMAIIRFDNPNKPTFKIDDIEYGTDALSPEARLRELQCDPAISQTARNAYLQALKARLPTPLETAMAQRCAEAGPVAAWAWPRRGWGLWCTRN